MQLKSEAFKPHQKIPSRFTGEGKNVSPPLSWTDAPAECREFALICEDPDAPQRPGKEHPFVHWVAYHIPADVTSLSEGVPTRKKVEKPAHLQQGTTSFGKVGYSGPMPPPGHGTHHYIFTLYALDSELPLAPEATRDELRAAMQGHVLAQAECVGTYERGAHH